MVRDILNLESYYRIYSSRLGTLQALFVQYFHVYVAPLCTFSLTRYHHSIVISICPPNKIFQSRISCKYPGISVVNVNEAPRTSIDLRKLVTIQLIHKCICLAT